MSTDFDLLLTVEVAHRSVRVIDPSSEAYIGWTAEINDSWIERGGKSSSKGWDCRLGYRVRHLGQHPRRALYVLEEQ